MTDLERRDRNLSARLAEAGIRPERALGLTFRLVAVDSLPPEEVAHVLGIPVGTVASRISKVRQRLLAAQDAHARGETGETDEPDDDDEADPLTEAARALLESIRNREGDGGPETALSGAALVTLADAKGIIREFAEARAARWDASG